MSATETISPLDAVHLGRGLPDRKLASITARDGGRSVSSMQQMEMSDEQTNAAEAEQNYPTGLRFNAIILSMACILVVSGLDSNILPTALPAITDHFNTTRDIGWYSAAFRLSSCSFSFMFGKLYKLFAIKRVFLTSICIFLLGTTFCAVAATSRILVLGRAVTGLGVCGIISGCFALLPYILPLRQRPLCTGLLSGVESIATITAPILGGVLTETLGWRSCFWMTLPLGGIALVVCYFFLQDLGSKEAANMTYREILSHLDLLGNLFFLPSITALFIALSWAGTQFPWSSPVIISLLCAWAVLFGAFVYMQYRRGERATLPPRIMRQRAVIMGAVFSICCSASINLLEYYMPLFFQIVREYPPTKSGYMMLPLAGGFLVSMLLQGAGTTLFGYHNPFALAGSLLLPIASGLVTTWTLDTGLWQLIAYGVLAGFAAGIGYQTPQVAVQIALSPSDAPLGLSVIMFANNFGPALFISIAQVIFTSQVGVNLRDVAPGLDASSIETMGFTELKAHVGPEQLQQVLQGFAKSLVQTWYLAVALGCATIIGSANMEWRSVKQKRS